MILATGAGAQVELDGATIAGGTVATSSSDVISASSGTNVFAGVTIAADTLVAVESGATLMLRGGTISKGTLLKTELGGTAIVSGTVVNKGTLFASGSSSLVEIVSGTVVDGGTVEIGNGVVDIQGASSREISFVAAGSGGIELDDAKAYTGEVVGFGGASHSNHSQFIDLSAIAYVSGVVSGSYKSGVLTVTSGGTAVATIHLAGSYVTADFQLASGASGSGTIITDPAVPHGGNAHSANVALLGNYIAGFAADGHGASVVSNAELIEPPPLLVHPHT